MEFLNWMHVCDDHLPCTMCAYTTADWLILWKTTTARDSTVCFFQHFISPFSFLNFDRGRGLFMTMLIARAYAHTNVFIFSAFQRASSIGLFPLLFFSYSKLTQSPLLMYGLFVLLVCITWHPSNYENYLLKIFYWANGFDINKIY